VERFDALVVGAGPAGSMTAFHLARGGARVLVVDKARFPRDKPCGGGVTLRAVRQLPFSIAPVVEDEIEVLELGVRYRRRSARRLRRPAILMTTRRRLDEFLLDRAQEAGAEFRHGTKGGVAAAVVIGADGANGTTGREAGLPGHFKTIGLEANAAVDAERFAGKAVLELGVVPGGYGWIFPKGDHVNVGVGGWLEEGPRLREHLARLCREHRIPQGAVTDVRGHHLPCRTPGAPIGAGRTLLVGDAAGLVDPLSGDGIYEAFVSARLAAEAVLADDLGRYEPAVTATLGPLHSASSRFKLALDRHPRLVYEVARRRPAWSVVERLVTGELTDPQAARGFGRLPLRLFTALGSE
jgi:geranylgeranyl reductase family protein